MPTTNRASDDCPVCKGTGFDGKCGKCGGSGFASNAIDVPTSSPRIQAALHPDKSRKKARFTVELLEAGSNSDAVVRALCDAGFTVEAAKHLIAATPAQIRTDAEWAEANRLEFCLAVAGAKTVIRDPHGWSPSRSLGLSFPAESGELLIFC